MHSTLILEGVISTKYISKPLCDFFDYKLKCNDYKIIKFTLKLYLSSKFLAKKGHFESLSDPKIGPCWYLF